MVASPSLLYKIRRNREDCEVASPSLLYTIRRNREDCEVASPCSEVRIARSLALACKIRRNREDCEVASPCLQGSQVTHAGRRLWCLQAPPCRQGPPRSPGRTTRRASTQTRFWAVCTFLATAMLTLRRPCSRTPTTRVTISLSCDKTTKGGALRRTRIPVRS
jgi:hypothetical protein